MLSGVWLDRLKKGRVAGDQWPIPHMYSVAMATSNKICHEQLESHL